METSETAISVRPLLQLQALPMTTQAMKGVVNSTHVLFKIVTGHEDTSQETKRPPINLSIVLDRSGSMGSKNKLTCAKEAIVKVIEGLSADDVLSFVVYGSDVTTIFENESLKPERKQALIDKVNAVPTSGMTNLWGGLEQGARLVTAHSRQGYTKRVFLFSDGLVNEGITDKKKILDMTAKEIYTEQDVKVSAFGLGDDFDEELMKGLAEYGCGAYFFIEGSSTIPQFTTFALKGLFKLVGTDALLSIRGKNGGIVKQIYGHEDLLKPYKLDDLVQDNERKVICDLDVTPNAAAESEEVLHYELSYRAANETSEDNRVKIEGTVNMAYVDRAEDIVKNNEVFVQIVIQQTAGIDKELVGLIDRGNLKEALALQEKQIGLFKSILELDEGGVNRVAGLLKQAEAALEDLKKEGLSKGNRKKAHHREYMKRRNSASYSENYIV